MSFTARRSSATTSTDSQSSSSRWSAIHVRTCASARSCLRRSEITFVSRRNLLTNRCRAAGHSYARSHRLIRRRASTPERKSHEMTTTNVRKMARAPEICTICGALVFPTPGERGSKTVCRSGSATSRRAAGCSAVAAVQAFPAALQRRNIDTIARSRNEARELQSVRDWPTKAGMQLAMRPRSAVAANVGSSMR